MPRVVIATSSTPTKPFPGPEMVTWLPPKIDTSSPPTTAAIIPEIGGASLAMASPSPKGSAIKLTTNPEKIFFGSALKNAWMLLFLELIVQLIYLWATPLKYVLYHEETSGPKTQRLLERSLPTNLP